MALLPPFYLDAVVALGVGDDPAKRSWIGTGFLYGVLESSNPPEKTYYVFLVTNKHVLRGQSKVWIKFNPAAGTTGKDFDAPLKSRNGKDTWVGHQKPDVDLAAMFINAQILQSHNMRFSYVRADEHVFTLAQLKSEGIAEGDGVFVLGYPLGLVDPQWRAGICRAGCIARLQDVLRAGDGEFLIDASVFPGNSGGPVILKPDATSITGTKNVSSANVIGVVKAYIPYQDIAVSPQTGHARITFDENSGLSPVIPIDRVNELMTLALRRLKSRLSQAKWKAKQAKSPKTTSG